MERPLADSRHGLASAEPASRISTIFVRALCEAVEAAGVSLERFVRAADFSPETFSNPYGWVEVRELDRLAGHAVALTDDQAFGLHWTERSPMVKFDLLAIMTAHAPTLRDALTCLLRFQPIMWQQPELEVVERSDAVFLRVHPSATTELGLRVRTEVGVASLVYLMRYVGAPETAVRRIAFSYQPPPYAYEYTRVFAGRARFGQAHSGIEIDPAWLDRRVDSANVELHQALTIQAQQVLTRVRADAGYIGQVRDYLRRVFPQLPEMREAARSMGLSERSLRRRLAEEGWSYSAILQESQLLLARQLLSDPTRSIKQVGFDVGFTSTAAFHRAFKRWTGESPAAFRSAGTRGNANAQSRRGAAAANASLERDRLRVTP